MDSIDKRCDSAVMYTLTPKEQKTFIEVYNMVYPENPIPSNVFGIRRMSEGCNACDYRLKSGEQHYCIKLEPEG